MRGTYSYTALAGIPHVLGADDAYIAYRYGWNLAQYHSLSWNESGFRRTEGFTNPLWVYLSALWSLTGSKDLVYPGMALTSVAITAGLLAVLALLVLRQTKSAAALVGLSLLSVSPVIWLHATSGLESSVFGAGAGLLAYYAITESEPAKIGIWWANALSSLVIVLRSDGFAYVAVLLFALLVSRNRNFRMLLPGSLLGVVTLLVWRELNFHQLMPNTQIAKLNFGLMVRVVSGLVLFSQSMLNGGIVLLVTALLALISAARPFRLAVVITLGGWAAYYVFIGGDLFLERHLIGLMVLAAAISGYYFARLLQHRGVLVLVAFLLVGVFVPVVVRDPRFLYFQPRPQDSWLLIGKEMARQRDLYGTVVTAPAGKIPYFAGGDFVDELGLNDPDLARIARPVFLPGHSAGSHELALALAKRSSPIYSYMGYNAALNLSNAQDVLLWADNRALSGGVHHDLTASERDTLMRASPLTFTLIFRGR